MRKYKRYSDENKELLVSMFHKTPHGKRNAFLKKHAITPGHIRYWENRCEHCKQQINPTRKRTNCEVCMTEGCEECFTPTCSYGTKVWLCAQHAGDSPEGIAEQIKALGKATTFNPHGHRIQRRINRRHYGHIRRRDQQSAQA